MSGHFERGFDQNCPGPQGPFGGIGETGALHGDCLGGTAAYEEQTPPPCGWFRQGLDFFAVTEQRPVGLPSLFVLSIRQRSPDLFRQTEITFPPRNCEIPVEGWDFF